MCKINTLVFHHKNHKITFLPIKIFHICPFSLLILNFKLSPFKSTIPLKTFFVHSFSLSLKLLYTTISFHLTPNSSITKQSSSWNCLQRIYLNDLSRYFYEIFLVFLFGFAFYSFNIHI